MTDTSTRVQLKDLGPISRFANSVIGFAKYLSPHQYLHHFFPSLKHRSDITPAEVADLAYTKTRAAAIERYVVAWCIIGILVVFLTLAGRTGATVLSIVCYALATIRIIEIVQVTASVTVFDRLSGRPDNIVASTARVLVLAFVNLIELVLWFGVLYSLNLSHLSGATGPAAAFYHSAMIQLTIGFSNIYPIGYLRVLTAVQAVVAVTFLVLVVARVVTALPQIRQLGDDS